MKLVSVIIPCFNDGAYIEEAIASVKAQTYKNIEIVICNDGSTDEFTLKVLERLQSSGFVVLNLPNKGPSAARNAGIKVSNGEYILPLDSDDCIDSTYIEKAVKLLESDESIGVVYCYGELFGAAKGKWELPDYSIERMIVDNIVFVTALFRKRDWEKVGGFCEQFTYGVEDYDFWLSILGLEKHIVQIPEVLFFYRIKETSRTTKFNGDLQKVIATYDLIYERHKDFYKLNMDLYCKSLRKELIERNAYAKQLESVVSINKKIDRIKDKLDRFPRIKIVVKKIYFKFFMR